MRTISLGKRDRHTQTIAPHHYTNHSISHDGEALLDFSDLTDLQSWLENYPG